MRKLSRREKILICAFVTVLVFIAGVRVLDIPASGILEMEAALEQLPFAALSDAEIELKTIQLAGEYEELNRRREAAASRLLPGMNPEELAYLLTEMLTAHGLDIVSLDIREAAREAPPPGLTGDVEAPALKVFSASMELSGPLSGFADFLDGVSRLESLVPVTFNAGGAEGIAAEFLAYTLN